MTERLTAENLLQSILQLCKVNDCAQNARIRLHVFRDENNFTVYTIEALPLDELTNQWAEDGLSLGLYPYARKSIDALSNLKSANFLPYVMANRYAVENNLNDALLLNVHQNLCDSSRANIFVIKDKTVYTPGLHQGCVNGVMRRMTIEVIKKLGQRFYEEELNEADLLNADEVFLTNAIQVIRWVRKYKHKEYSSVLTKKIFENVTTAIY